MDKKNMHRLSPLVWLTAALLALPAFAQAQSTNQLCPLMIEDEIDPEEFVMYKGKKIMMCCSSCKDQWESNPDYYAVVSKDSLPQLADVELPDIEVMDQRFCPVYTDRRVDPSSPTSEYNGQKIYFSKTSAIRRFDRAPERYYEQALEKGILKPADEAKEETKNLKVGEFTFPYTTGKWVQDEEPSAMSKGGLIFKPSKDKEEKLSINFYHFGKGQGGSVEDNIERWKKQFSGEPKAGYASHDLAGRKLHTLEVQGTFLDGAPFGPKTEKEDYSLLGAIIESEEGPVFLKLVGPKNDVAKVKRDFIGMIQAALKEKAKES